MAFSSPLLKAETNPATRRPSGGDLRSSGTFGSRAGCEKE